MAGATNKDMAVLMRQAERQGWEITLTGKNHYKWMHPLNGLFFSSSTPSDKQAVNQVRRDLTRRGFIIIERKKKRK
jgi:hypothetical protein